jgi:cysteine-rich repeat protein
LRVGTEECDDENENSNDGCFPCVPEEGWSCDEEEPSVCVTVCGDGIVKGEEECDDGN